MADKSAEIKSFLSRIEFALSKGNFPSFNFKPLQLKCLEYVFKGQDVIGILPTGFGKSIIFHLLPHFIAVKKRKNIVIVVCPLNSIIEDQLRVLRERNITSDVLQLAENYEPIENLFAESQEPSQASSDHVEPKLKYLPSDMVNGNTSIIFAHPEALLSKEGRKLMGSKVFQDNVVALVVDEAHCVKVWGEEFRKDFKELSSVRAFFPGIPLVALTATAPPCMIDSIKNGLCLVNAKVVSANPDRVNIYLSKKIRKANCYGYEGYDDILKPIANELFIQREQYPMTIIYMKLKYCGYAYSLFERVLGDRQYVGETRDPSSRLFAQFHAPQTNQMKKDIVHEIKRNNSRIRVIFATSALGMGVDAPCITHVIHIRPQSNIESYMQEMGRAGRDGLQAWATLYYNNSDVSGNKKNVSDEMKAYCKSNVTCLRKIILQYLGFTHRYQKQCCCLCDGSFKDTYESLLPVTRAKVRILPPENRAILKELIGIELALQDEEMDCRYGTLLPTETDPDKIIDCIEFIETESDLLEHHGIWNEICSSHVFHLISEYAPLKDQDF